MTRTNVALCWALGTETGWGLLGKYTALTLQDRYRARPLFAARNQILDLNPVEGTCFEPIRARSDRLLAMAAPEPTPETPLGLKTGIKLPGVALAALGNGLRPQFKDQRLEVRGDRNVALIFTEDSDPSPDTTMRLRAYDAVIAGSTWAGEVLRSRGVANLHVGLQGVDRFLFHPAPPRDLLRDRFIVFSGGKFEYRKGQDIVVAAFKRFQRRHPEALLFAMWANNWLRGRGLRLFSKSPHQSWIPTLPPLESRFDWARYLATTEVPETAIKLAGEVRHRHVAEFIRFADVAVFPNRAEAGTNLVAMQAMACGVPTILSTNTGHLDIIEDGACLPLLDQTPINGVDNDEIDGPIGLNDWRESSVDEVDDALERIYRDRAERNRIGERGARWMQGFGWDRHTAVIAEAAEIEPLFNNADLRGGATSCG